MKYKASIGILLASVFLLVPFISHAAPSLIQVVPTSGQCNCTYAPDWGCVLQFVQNILNDAVAVGTIIISGFIARAGFMFISQPGNAAARTKARQSVINAVLGLAIVLGAWLLIDSVMKEIYNQNANGAGVASLGPWNSLMVSNGHDYCIQPNSSTLATSVTGAASQLVSPTNPGGGTPPANSGSSGLNVAAAVAYLDAHAQSTSTHRCLAAIEGAMSAGGKSLSCPPNGYADACNQPLINDGLSNIGSNDGSPQAGDIVVIQPYSGETGIGGKAGHIAMYDGSKWVSDFTQIDFWGGPGYRSNQPSHEFYRP